MNKSTAALRDSWKERFRALKNIPALVRIVWQSGPSVVMGVLVCRLVAALLPLAILSVSRKILDAIQSHFVGHPLVPDFWWLVGAEFVLAATGTVAGRAIGYFDLLLADRFSRHVSLMVMEHASRLDLSSYEDPLFHDKLERARAQATDRVMMIQAIGSLAQQTITGISLALGILWFSPWILVLLTAAIVPAFVGEGYFVFLGYALHMHQTPTRRKLDYLRQIGASKESAKELRLFGMSSFLSGRFADLSGQIYEEDAGLARRRLLVGLLLSLLSTGGYYACYAYVIFRTLTGAVTWGTLQFLAGAIAGASSNMQGIFSTFSNIAEHSLFLTHLVQFLEVKPKLRSRPDAMPAPRPIRHGLIFDKVSFSYGNGRKVLDNFNFYLGPGERVALIGENGQGKTTIVKLAARLYDPTCGRILLDGIDLRDYDIDDLQRQITVIFQDFMRYEMTARENIALAQADSAQDWTILEAARKSLADEVIEKLPDQYRQLLGLRFEGGTDLSGGEWQKIALARAYFRDAQMVILDEPTASLDARSELEIFQRFAALTEGKATLLISHRFSSVRMSDRIVVLENGRIVEQGSHSKLLALGGRYADMFEMQAASYR